MHLKILVATIAFILTISGAYAQDGARAYFPLPAGTNDIDLTATFSQLEYQGSIFNSFVITPSYRHSFDLFGDAATFLIGWPVGKLSASVNSPVGPIDLETDPAQGDFFVGGTLGLLGAPALSPLEYVQFQPGLAVSVTTKLFVPTGAYDSNRLLNLGGNRWSLQAALPITYMLGSSILDPGLTTLEVVPSVQIFSDNEDAFGPVNVFGQAPIFAVEGHITRSFGQGLWGAVDGSAEFGGETSADGSLNGDAHQAVSLGATFGLSLSPSVAVRLNYQEQVYSNISSSDSRRFMATSAFLF